MRFSAFSTIYNSRDMIDFLEFHHLIFVLCMCHLKYQKVVEGRGTIPVPVKTFLAKLFYFVEKHILCQARKIRASVAQMAGTRDDHVGDDPCIDMLLATSGGLEIYRYTGQKRDNKWSLRMVYTLEAVVCLMLRMQV